MNEMLTEASSRTVISDIVHNPRFNEGEFDDVITYLVETASNVLNCNRASIWRYSEDNGKAIECLVQLDRNANEITRGGVLEESAAASYLNALKLDTLLIIDEVRDDSRCVELNEEYLPRHNIFAMLDAPFQFNGKLGGVLCCEHVGSPRSWTVTEQHFAANMASLITIASERAERRQIEEKLIEEEQRYRTLVEDLAMGLVIFVDSKIVFANKTASEITQQFGIDSLLGVSLFDLYPNASDKVKAWVDKQLAGSDRSTLETGFPTTDGSTAVLEITTSSVIWSGQPAIQGVFRDVTKAAFAQSRLRRSERLLSQAQRIARMGSWVWDVRNDETECSLELRNLLGIRQGNPLTTPISSLAHKDDRPNLNAVVNHAVKTGESYQLAYRVNTPAGELWLEEIGMPELGEGGQVIRVHGTSRDITSQKRAELKAEATEERFSALGNTFPGGFVYCDLSHQFLFINKMFAEWLEIEPDDFYGKHVVDLITEPVLENIQHYLDDVLAGNSLTFEIESTSLGDDLRQLQITLAPDRNDTGEMRGYFALLTNITDIKNMEQALRQIQRMDAIGQLTGGIAHDFNNILAILMGNLELALQNSTNAASSDYISAALQGVGRGVTLTQKLLSFARNSTTGTREVSIDHAIDDIRAMIKQSIGSTIEVVTESDDGLWTTDIDPGDFEGALINLCTNARDAMPRGGKLMIRTANRSLDETSRRIHPALRPGDYVLVSVTDTGTGMDAATQEQLFDPFYTTKPEGKGTGLGMSMVFGFVKRSKGQIVVYSAINEGSTVNIYLPRYQGSEETRPELPTIESGQSTANESILIVDDEDMVGSVAASILSELGYRARVVSSSTTALEIIQDDPDIDMLFSDVVMPEDLNGFELARAAVKVRPALKVLLTSGFSKFSGTEPVDEETRSLAANILTKPYNREELASSVRAVLQSGDARIAPQRATRKSRSVPVNPANQAPS